MNDIRLPKHPITKIITLSLLTAIRDQAKKLSYVFKRNDREGTTLQVTADRGQHPKVPARLWPAYSIAFVILRQHAEPHNLLGTFTSSGSNTDDNPERVEERWDVKFHEYPEGDLLAELQDLIQRTEPTIEKALKSFE